MHKGTVFDSYCQSVQLTRGLGVSLLASGLFACERPLHRSAPESVTSDPRTTAAREAKLEPSADLEPRSDPAAPAGDLKTDIERFTSLDRCIEEQGKLGPTLGDALEAIGYDTLLHDACRVIEAAKVRDSRHCDGILASSLRKRCFATVAELEGNAEACPWDVESRRALGRDPACLAVASRDARLCAAAADTAERATCEAISAHDDAACARLGSRSSGARMRCARDAARWLTAVPAATARAGPSTAVGGFRLTQAGGDAAGPSIEGDLTADLERGIVLVEQRDGTHLVLGPLTTAGPGFVAPSPHVRATVALELRVAAGSNDSRQPAAGRVDDPVVERLELLIPGHAPLATPSAHAALRFRLDRFARARGSEVKIAFEGEVGDGTSAWRVSADWTTFVRDVVRSAEMLESNARRLGQDDQMR